MNNFSADPRGDASPGMEEPSPDETVVSAESRFSEPRPLRPVGPGRPAESALVPSAEAASTALRAADHLSHARTPEVAADDPWVEAAGAGHAARDSRRGTAVGPDVVV